MQKGLLLSLFFVLCFSCKKQQNPNTISKKGSIQEEFSELISYKKLENFASGSGMTFYNQYYYVVGDDDPYLAKIDNNGEIIERFQLWDTLNMKNGRINKKIKPDFEAITTFPSGKDTLMLIFGSGSKSPKRDVMLTFHPSTKSIDTLNGEEFFKWLKTEANLSNKEINLEGAVYDKGFLYLLNRHNNDLYKIPEKGIRYFMHNASIDSLSILKYNFQLPSYQSDTARFSGATILKEKNQLLFSATIEKTDNWQDDGKILGSFLGKINIDSLANNKPICKPVFNNDSTRFQGKIEGLKGEQKADQLFIKFITDDDDGSTGWGEVIF